MGAALSFHKYGKHEWCINYSLHKALRTKTCFENSDAVLARQSLNRYHYTEPTSFNTALGLILLKLVFFPSIHT